MVQAGDRYRPRVRLLLRALSRCMHAQIAAWYGDEGEGRPAPGDGVGDQFVGKCCLRRHSQDAKYLCTVPTPHCHERCIEGQLMLDEGLLACSLFNAARPSTLHQPSFLLPTSLWTPTLIAKLSLLCLWSAASTTCRVYSLLLATHLLRQLTC